MKGSFIGTCTKRLRGRCEDSETAPRLPRPVLGQPLRPHLLRLGGELVYAIEVDRPDRRKASVRGGLGFDATKLVTGRRTEVVKRVNDCVAPAATLTRDEDGSPKRSEPGNRNQLRKVRQHSATCWQ